MLKIENLAKSYNSDDPVLHDLSIEIKKGEIFAIIGPSGVGKSTFLRLIDLLDSPSSRKIIFNGVEMTTLPEKQQLEFRRKMGMVFQTTVLFDGTVANNVAYGLNLRKIPSHLMHEKIMKALGTVGLSHLEKRNANQLSGGEAQRVAIARILAYNPEILLMDEPSANLDPSNTVKLENSIRKARDEYGTTVILATHNMYQAKRLGDRIAVLLNGNFIEVGDKETIFDHPKEELTRKFVTGEYVF